ncbi:hypothetical protein KAW64_04790, partial [bacterium]|nr:hypothetical protein [bacterium]
VVWLPEDLMLITPVAVFQLTCESHEDDHSIVWKRSIAVNERSISLENYGKFKENFDALASPKNRLILLKKA